MNKLTIIGNLTRDPETRISQSGNTICSFSVAVNRTGKNANGEADFFRVSAWNKLGEKCQQYLTKGKKVCVVGKVSVSTYQGSDGSTRASMDVIAEDVEFLSSRQDDAVHVPAAPKAAPAANAGYQEIDDENLPF